MESMSVWNIITATFTHVAIIFLGIALMKHREFLDYIIRVTGLNKVLKYEVTPATPINSKIRNLIIVFGAITIIYGIISFAAYLVAMIYMLIKK